MEINAVMFLKKMRKLMALMEGSKQATADPQEVLDNIYNQFGDKVNIGAQKDLIEVFIIIVDLLDLAFKTVIKISRGKNKMHNKNLIKENNLLKGKLVGEMFDQEMNRTSNPQEEDLVSLTIQPSSLDIRKALDERFRYTIEMEDSNVG